MRDFTKVVGVAPVGFTTDDGKTITGNTIYYTEPLEPCLLYTSDAADEL